MLIQQVLRASRWLILTAGLTLLASCGGGGNCTGIAIALGSAACGGGGGGGSTPVSITPPSATVISGTAAAGAPIVGTVTIKDSSQPPKEKFVTIAADGKYTIDVSGLTPPFMLRADGTVGGRSYSLYSAAASADVGGTVNITPLTDLIVANIAGQIAANFYQSGNFGALTPSALNAAETALQARLQPVLSALGLASTIDLLRASFSADRTGVDAALDILRVTVDPATAQATITNVITNQQIIDNLASQSDSTVLTNTTGVATGFTDFQQIVAQFDKWTALFATSLPASNNAALNALFDGPAFLLDGQNLAAFLSEITSAPALVGAKFTVVTLDSLTPASAPTSAQVQWSVTTGAGGSLLHVGSSKLNKVNGVWLIAGNQRIAGGTVITFARRNHLGVIDTGLAADGFRDEGGRGIDYAIVTGKGLPTTTGGANGTSAGLLLVNYTSNNSFGIAQSGAAYNGISTPKITAGHNQFPLADAAINTIADNEVYTVEWWDDNNTPSNLADDVKMATYTDVLGKRPYLNSELTAASFATITTTPAAIQSAATTGGNLVVTWTLPAGLRSFQVHFFRSYSSGSSDSIDADPTGTATSVTLTIAAPTGTVYSSGINLFVEDVFGRELKSELNGQ